MFNWLSIQTNIMITVDCSMYFLLKTKRCMIFQMKHTQELPHINLLQVIGGSGRLYTCFVSCHYCPCPAFAYTVLRRNEGLLVSLTKLLHTVRAAYQKYLAPTKKRLYFKVSTECLVRFVFFFLVFDLNNVLLNEKCENCSMKNCIFPGFRWNACKWKKVEKHVYPF